MHFYQFLYQNIAPSKTKCKTMENCPFAILSLAATAAKTTSAAVAIVDDHCYCMLHVDL